MLFSFELLNVACERVLSTEDSEWGEADGIRVYFIVLTTGGFNKVLVSGREFPPPDIADNFSFVPGKSFDLKQYPPQNAGNWQVTPQAGLSDIDSAMVTIVGVNEGLPWVGGGGGFGAPEKANLKAFEEIAQKGSEKAGEHIIGAAGEAVGGAAFGAAWSLIEGAIEEINRASECRGIAFCFPIELSMRKLLLDHLLATETTHRIDESSPSTGLGLVAAAQHPAGCGSPRYAVDLRIGRSDQLYLMVGDVEGESREGEHTVVPVRRESCRPSSGAEMHTWPVYTDRTITVTPSHFYASLKPTWFVNGVELGRDEDTLNLSVLVNTHPGGDETERPVTVRYERILHGGNENLVLHTRGEDGNFKLDVSLRMNFEGVHPPPPDPWVEFRSEVVWVGGSDIAGDDAWVGYLRCVIQHQWEEEVIKVEPGKPPGKKLDPAKIAALGHEFRTLVIPQVLAEHHLGVR
jgi:hypothetical protein